ncbi:MAG: hypothetical protein IJX55_10165 [Clostridia bacterium]|nr:hypothetical protein [Clostridia bacterium]
MEGIFREKKQRVFLALAFVVAGAFIAVKFSLFGIDEVNDGHIASAFFCFGFAVFWYILGSFFIVVGRFNKGAKLKADSEKITAFYGWDKQLSLNLSDIVNVEVYSSTLRLYTSAHYIEIHELLNAAEIRIYIMQRIDIKRRIPCGNIGKETEKMHVWRRKFNFWRAISVIFAVLMFANIIICTVLTGRKDTCDFSGKEEVVFIISGIAEIVIVILLFVFAKKCGKSNELYKQSKNNIAVVCAYKNRAAGLEKYTGVVSVKYFDRYFSRIVIFSSEKESFEYAVERFDMSSLDWVFCGASERVFPTLQELYEDLSFCFYGEFFEQ